MVKIKEFDSGKMKGRRGSGTSLTVRRHSGQHAPSVKYGSLCLSINYYYIYNL